MFGLISASLSGSSQLFTASTIAVPIASGVLGAEDTRPDEDAVAAVVHHQRRVGGRRDAAGGEVHDRERPISAVSWTSSAGASFSRAQRSRSSNVLPWSSRMAPLMVRWWWTAWLTSPVPASPWSGSSPRPRRCGAGPHRGCARLQTNGEVKSRLSMWYLSSAGVGTSDSSTMSTPTASRIWASFVCPMRTCPSPGWTPRR